MSTKNFGKKLKEARIERGFSQRSLGLSIGLSDKTISSYESSRSYPSLDVLKKLSEVLRKPFDYFLSLEDKQYIDDRELLLKQIDKLEEELIKLKQVNREE